MILEKKKLLAMADRWEKKARNAEARYQETGDRRYLREKENNEDLADAIRMAANAEEDYSELVQTRGRLADYQAAGLTPAEIVALKTERDAAVKDIEEMLRLPRDHTDCIHFCRYDPAGDCPFSFGKDCEPKWRGPEKDCVFYGRHPNEREGKA